MIDPYIKLFIIILRKIISCYELIAYFLRLLVRDSSFSFPGAGRAERSHAKGLEVKN
jgi:hypothetical protein